MEKRGGKTLMRCTNSLYFPILVPFDVAKSVILYLYFYEHILLSSLSIPFIDMI